MKLKAQKTLTLSDRWGGLCLLCAFLLTISLLLSCSEPQSGVETTNGLEIAVVQLQGGPAQNAQVRIIDLNGWKGKVQSSQSVVLDSGVTDSKGKLTLKKPKELFAIEVVYAGDQALYQGNLNPAKIEDVQTHRLTNTRRIEGLVNGAESGMELRIVGSSTKAKIDAQGRYSMVVPMGEYAVVIFDSTQKISSVGALSVQNDSVILPEMTANTKQVLLEDFESNDRVHLFASVTGGGTWFWSTDSISSIIPLQGQNKMDAALIDSGSYVGKSMRVLFDINDLATDRFANIGLNLGASMEDSLRHWVNLCGVDSLVFYAKGMGTVLLQFTTPLFEENPTHPILYSTLFDLNEAWTRHVIALDLIIPMNGRVDQSADYPTWKESCQEVRSINFTFDKSGEFWLDDLQVIGDVNSLWMY